MFYTPDKLDIFTVSVRKNGYDIPVRVIYKDVKGLNLRMKNGAFYSSAPVGVNRGFIERFINKHTQWIVREYEKWLSSQDNKKIADKVFLLGKPYHIVKRNGENAVELSENNIFVNANNGCGAQSVFNAWWGANARRYLAAATEQAFNLCGEVLGIRKLPDIEITFVTSYWGKCFFTKNLIKYNAALMQADEDCIKKVIFHELAHFKVHNHQRDFYLLLNKLYPNAGNASKKLKSYSARNFPPNIE